MVLMPTCRTPACRTGRRPTGERASTAYVRSRRSTTRPTCSDLNKALRRCRRVDGNRRSRSRDRGFVGGWSFRGDWSRRRGFVRGRKEHGGRGHGRRGLVAALCQLVGAVGL